MRGGHHLRLAVVDDAVGAVSRLYAETHSDRADSSARVSLEAKNASGPIESTGVSHTRQPASSAKSQRGSSRRKQSAPETLGSARRHSARTTPEWRRHVEFATKAALSLSFSSGSSARVSRSDQSPRSLCGEYPRQTDRRGVRARSVIACKRLRLLLYFRHESASPRHFLSHVHSRGEKKERGPSQHKRATTRASRRETTTHTPTQRRHYTSRERERERVGRRTSARSKRQNKRDAKRDAKRDPRRKRLC